MDGDSTMGKYPVRDYKAKLKEKFPLLYTLSFRFNGLKKKIKHMLGRS